MRRVVLLYLVVFNSRIIFADTGGEKEEWNPVSAGPVTTWTSPLCGREKFVIQPFFIYNRSRGSFDSNGHFDSLPSGEKRYQYQQQVFMQYGLTEKLEIDGQFVYQENFARQDGLKAHSSGFGDSFLFLRYCAVEEGRFMPHITGLFQVKFPTGKFQHANPEKLGTDLMGSGSYDTGYGIILTKRIKPMILHLDAIYSFTNQVRVDGVTTKYGEYLNYDIGLEYFLSGGFNLMLEFNGYLQDDKRQDGKSVPDSDVSSFAVSPGIGWSNDKIQMLLAYQRTLTGVNADAGEGVVLTFVYAF